jgi:hypothetical protein
MRPWCYIAVPPRDIRDERFEEGHEPGSSAPGACRGGSLRGLLSVCRWGICPEPVLSPVLSLSKGLGRALAFPDIGI